MTITPRLFRVTSSVLFAVAFVVYLGFEVLSFARAPKLNLLYPDSKFIFEESNFLTLEGETSRDSRVFLNGEELLVSPDGSFRENIYLPEGTSVLRFKALSRQGKETKLTHYVKR